MVFPTAVVACFPKRWALFLFSCVDSIAISTPPACRLLPGFCLFRVFVIVDHINAYGVFVALFEAFELLFHGFVASTDVNRSG